MGKNQLWETVLEVQIKGVLGIIRGFFPRAPDKLRFFR